MSDQADGLRRMVRSLEGREGPPTLVADAPPSRNSERRRARAVLLGLFPALAARFGRPASRAESGSVGYSD